MEPVTDKGELISRHHAEEGQEMRIRDQSTYRKWFEDSEWVLKDSERHIKQELLTDDLYTYVLQLE